MSEWKIIKAVTDFIGTRQNEGQSENVTQTLVLFIIVEKEIEQKCSVRALNFVSNMCICPATWYVAPWRRPDAYKQLPFLQSTKPLNSVCCSKAHVDEVQTQASGMGHAQRSSLLHLLETW